MPRPPLLVIYSYPWKHNDNPGPKEIGRPKSKSSDVPVTTYRDTTNTPVCTCDHSKLGRYAECVHKLLLLSLMGGQKRLATHMEINSLGAHVRFCHETPDVARIYGVQQNPIISPIRTFVSIGMKGQPDYCSGKKEGCSKSFAHLKHAKEADAGAKKPAGALQKELSPEEVAGCVAFLDGLTEPAPISQAAIGFVNQLQIGAPRPPTEAQAERPQLLLLGLPPKETEVDQRPAPLKRRSKNFAGFQARELAIALTPDPDSVNQLAVVEGGRKPSTGRGLGAIKCMVLAWTGGTWRRRSWRLGQQRCS